MVALSSICLVLLNLIPGAFTEWWEPLKSCWLWEDAKILGVELRMTDKKRMGGSCDFLVQMPDKSSSC